MLNTSAKKCTLRGLTYTLCLLAAAVTLLMFVTQIRSSESWLRQPLVDVPEVAGVFNAEEYEAKLANTTEWSDYQEANKATKLRPALAKGTIQCWRIGQVYPDEIPPIVHFTSKRGNAMKKHVQYLKSWIRLLNNSKDTRARRFRFMHWTDQQLDTLIGTYYPTLYRVYRQLTNELERSDIGRLVVMHHVGGVYADIDVELRRDLRPLLTNYSAVWSQEPVEHALFLYNKPRLISNALIMSRPGQAFLTYVLQRWPAWFQWNWAYRKRTSMEAVFTTGPMMLNDFYDEYIAKMGNKLDELLDNSLLLAEPDMFQPIWDTKYLPRKSRFSCEKPENRSSMKRRLCRQLAKRNFTTKSIPTEAYTVHVHWFMHTSYKELKSKKVTIGESLPMSYCVI